MTTLVMTESTAENQNPIALVLTRADWKARGYRVPTKAEPAEIDLYQVPGYRSVWRERHLFSFDQVVKVSDEQARKRSRAAKKGLQTRIVNMQEAMESAELTIVRGKTPTEVYRLARGTHGGNYMGDPGPFVWSNRKARNAIRHNLTNYEAQWTKINRSWTGDCAYNILRDRVDRLVDEAYPEYAEGMPEVPVPPLN